MRIGIDIDDTITNSSDTFVKYAKKYNNEKKINHIIDQTTLDPQKSFGWNKKNIKEFLDQYLEEVLNNTEAKNDSIKIINKLKKEGNEIIFITSRSENEIKNNMFKLTEMWLKKHNYKYDLLIIDSKDKVNDCIKYKIDVFIDDNYNNCKKVEEKTKIPVLIYSTRYNIKENDNSIIRVNDWFKIYYFLKGGENMKKNNKPLEFYDVDRRDEFPKEPKGMRFVYFYGGTKNYRGYLVPEDLSRADFMEMYPEYIPVQNIPIYEHNGIILRADPKFSCPGFYILSLSKTYRAFDLLDDVTFLRFSFILKKSKEAMRKALGLNYAHLLSNEKSDPFVNVHFWLLPVNGTTSPDLLDFDVKSYLDSFVPKEEINKIIDYNNKMREYFEKIDLKGQDDILTKKISYLK